MAFTRAKLKLFIVGSIGVLEKIPIMEKFVRFIENNNWVFDFNGISC